MDPDFVCRDQLYGVYQRLATADLGDPEVMVDPVRPSSLTLWCRDRPVIRAYSDGFRNDGKTPAATPDLWARLRRGGLLQRGY